MAAAPLLAIIDMGSNAIRLLVAECPPGRPPVTLMRERAPVRLGGEVFRTGHLPADAIAEAVATCRRFRAVCDLLGVERIRAVATAAVREAENRDELRRAVRRETDIDLQVVSGEEEARLLFLGVGTRLDLGAGRSLLVDVGGGSTEILVVDHGRIIAANSHPFGALRLTQLYAAENGREGIAPWADRFLSRNESLVRDTIGAEPVERYAAVGGGIEALADLALGLDPGTSTDAACLPLATLEAETNRLAHLTQDERLALGLRPDRADLIVPGGMVYAWIGRLAGAEIVEVPRTGILHGLLAQQRLGE